MWDRAEQSNAATGQTAREWVVRRDRGLTLVEQKEFDRWIDESPLHAAEFERAARAWDRLERIQEIPRFQEAADLLLHDAWARRRRRRLGFVAGSLVAAAAAVALAYLGLRPESWLPDDTPNYEVLASTARTMHLPDGSTVLLNGDARMETAYTASERRVRLLRGEALFSVAKNPARPFFVTAGPVTVRAVGTAFNVRIAATEIDVLVTEGRVRVNESTTGGSLLPAEANGASGGEGSVLVAGQNAVVPVAAKTPPAVVTVLAPQEIEQQLAWQANRLVFNNTPLEDVVSAFNRYNSRRLVLGSPDLRTQRITGVFRADNLDGFTRLLEAGADIKARVQSPTETVLGPAR